MNRRAFLGAAGLLTVPLDSLVWAQSESRVYRIGFLGSDPPSAPRHVLLGTLLRRLQELGYSEGRNLVLEHRTSQGRNERYLALATELVGLKVDLIIAPGTAAALAAKTATRSIPIVTIVVGDPVESGLIKSLARPGGNVTGTSSAASEVTVKQLELLKEIVPRLSRIAVLANRSTPLHVTVLKDLEAAARPLRVRLDTVEVRTPQGLESAFTTIARNRPEALVPLDDPLIFRERRRIADFALRQRVPTSSFQRFFTEAGMLVSYGPNFADLFRRAATYVDRILKGANPADLPVEQPTQFELVINLRTAKALGLTVPPSLLARADQVIK